MYWLTRSVTQKADPTVLPHGPHMAARATDAMKARLLRLTQRNASNADN